MNDLLFDKQRHKLETFTSRISVPEPSAWGQSDHDLTIIFENGVFREAKFTMSGTYSRHDWRVLAAIEEEISRLEKQLEDEKTEPLDLQ